MALPNKILPGFSATLYCQPTSTPTPLTTAALSTYATVSALAISGNLVPVEAIPAFGTVSAHKHDNYCGLESC
jgi:hypothetical protein